MHLQSTIQKDIHIIWRAEKCLNNQFGTVCEKISLFSGLTPNEMIGKEWIVVQHLFGLTFNTDLLKEIP